MPLLGRQVLHTDSWVAMRALPLGELGYGAVDDIEVRVHLSSVLVDEADGDWLEALVNLLLLLAGLGTGRC